MQISMLLIGLLAGICSGIFGIGGGVVLIPALVLFFKYPQAMANGTSLVALLLPVGLLGVLEYYKAGRIGAEQIWLGLYIAVGMFFGAYLGARLAVYLPTHILSKLFAAFLSFVAFRMFMSK